MKVQTDIVDENEIHFLCVCLFHESFSFLGNWGKFSRNIRMLLCIHFSSVSWKVFTLSVV